MDILAAVLLIAGFFFLMVGTIGLLRLPDTFTRLHATGKCDTLGALLVVLGCALLVREPAPSLKLLAIAFFIWIVSPATAHMIARVARLSGAEMIEGTRHLQVELEVNRRKERSNAR